MVHLYRPNLETCAWNHLHSPRQSHLCATTDSLQCIKSSIAFRTRSRIRHPSLGCLGHSGAHFDNINDLGYLFYPEDLDFFIEWELHDQLLRPESP